MDDMPSRELVKTMKTRRGFNKNMLGKRPSYL